MLKDTFGFPKEVSSIFRVSASCEMEKSFKNGKIYPVKHFKLTDYDQKFLQAPQRDIKFLRVFFFGKCIHINLYVNIYTHTQIILKNHFFWGGGFLESSNRIFNEKIQLPKFEKIAVVLLTLVTSFSQRAQNVHFGRKTDHVKLET